MLCRALFFEFPLKFYQFTSRKQHLQPASIEAAKKKDTDRKSISPRHIARDSLPLSSEHTKAGNIRRRLSFTRRNFGRGQRGGEGGNSRGEIRVWEKVRRDAKMFGDSPFESRANANLSVSSAPPDAQKRADCALHLPWSILLPHRERERGHRIRASKLRRAKTAETGELRRRPSSKYWLGLLMQFFCPKYTANLLSLSRRKGKKTKETSNNYLQKWSPFEPNRFRSATSPSRGMSTEVTKDFRKSKLLNVLLVLL